MLFVCRGGGLPPDWDEADVLGYPWQWPVALLEVEELSFHLQDAITEGLVLVLCSSEELLLSEFEKSDFGNRIVWLINEVQNIETVSSNLPLTLESNLLAFEFDNVTENVNISEIYSIKSNNERRNHFGYWNTQEGLAVPEPVIWERRSDLSGVTLINTVLDWKPMIAFDPNNDTITGLFPDILFYIQAHLNFRLLILYVST